MQWEAESVTHTGQDVPFQRYGFEPDPNRSFPGTGVNGSPANGSGPNGSGPHGPAGTGANGATSQRVAASPDVRNAAVTRLMGMNAMHGMHAFEHLRQGDNRIGPHAIAFLYRDIDLVALQREYRATGEPPPYAVRAATRLFPDGQEVSSLTALLGSMIDIASDYLDGGRGFDPRLCMSDRRDPAMSNRAEYIGIGISSLDSPAGTWEQIQQRAVSPLDVPGRGYIYLYDGTRIIFDRGGPYGMSGRTYSTDQLGTALMSARPWSWLQDNALDPRIWNPLRQFFDAVWEGHRRLAETGA